MKEEKIRKQVYDLAPEDLGRYPIWEFALDEETKEGQDEATVKPYVRRGVVDPEEGMFIVRTRFTAADGTVFEGYSTPGAEYHPGDIQPTIVTPRGQINFWCGMLKPKEKELKERYQILGKEPSELFPLRFEAIARSKGVPLNGVVNGFSYLDEDDKVLELR